MSKHENKQIRDALLAPAGGADLDAMVAKLAEKAGRDGLIDVAYAEADSPFGQLILATTPRGLVKIGLPNQDPDEVLGELAEKVSPRVLESPAGLDEVQRELDDYFAGRRHEFELALDYSLIGGFRGKVVRQIARIPYGKTVTYTDMARRAGNERAVRAAGTACGRNPIPIVVPCHRVLRSGGGLGGYGGGVEMKEGLLKLEGVLS
jgi:methylated-DNA-[protein]-cysteine S-methyltransferase